MPRRGFNRIELIVVLGIIATLVGLAFSSSGTWLLEIPFTLALGWVAYIWRVIPKLNPDPWTVGTAIACLAGVTVGSHYFLRWVAGSESRWPWKRTLRIVGLIVLMFVSGIAVVGMIHQTSWLVRSPEPLTIHTGNRTMSANNLKQISLAGHNVQSASDSQLPRSTFNATGQPMHSWQAVLLPYIEQDNVFKKIGWKKPWTDPVNTSPLGTHIHIYMNFAYSGEKVNGLGVSHYAGNVQVVLGDAKKFDSFPAGVSNTILAGEVSSNFRAWGDPLNARDPRFGSNGHPQGFGGPNRPALFAMLDGSVKTFDSKELAELMSKVQE